MSGEVLCPSCGRGFFNEKVLAVHRQTSTSCQGLGVPVAKQVAPQGEQHDGFVPLFSNRGRELLEDVCSLHPMPVLLLGGTGWGKSVLVREAARRKGLPLVATNAHPGMDITLLVGMWRPKPNGAGVSVVWEDGVLSGAIKSGKAFLMEELTRAPQEAVSRLFGLLDNGFRSWPLPEGGVEQIEVHPNFWFLASANPWGEAGYTTVPLDPALYSRFAGVFRVDCPLADERTILVRMGVEPAIIRWLMDVAEDARRQTETSFPTRDLILCAQAIVRGWEPRKALSVAVAPKVGNAEALLKIGSLYNYLGD